MTKRDCLLLLPIVILTACSSFQHNRSNDPKSCRERAAYHIIAQYTDPVLLSKALDAICAGQEGK